MNFWFAFALASISIISQERELFDDNNSEVTLISSFEGYNITFINWMRLEWDKW